MVRSVFGKDYVAWEGDQSVTRRRRYRRMRRVAHLAEAGGGGAGRVGVLALLVWGALTALALALALGGGAREAVAQQTASGKAKAWGLNDYGQSTVPDAAQGGVKAIAGGAFHSLALKGDGTVVAWGGNAYGQTTVPSGLNEAEAVAGSFGHSLALEIPTPAGPVDLFEADAGQGQVSLSWSNPTDPDFRAVRVLRSTTGLATSPTPDAEQVQVYEGTGESFKDSGLENGTTYYYTAYTRDDAGLWSARTTRRATPAAAPPAPTITDPANNTRDADGFFVVRGTAQPGAMVRLYEGTARVDTDEADPVSGAWRMVVGEAPEGSHSYRARATDAAGNASDWSNTLKVIVDTTGPSVGATSPASGATGVAVGANVTATFSEAMEKSTVTASTVKLVKAGTTTAVPATVGYDRATKKATLNPSAKLAKGTRYKATVSTGAKDLAGNALDQSKALAGEQPKVWSFVTAR